MKPRTLVIVMITTVWLFACSSEPQTAHEHLLEGMQAAASGKFTEALHSYRKAIELEPDNPDLYVTRAITHHMAGDAPSAIADYEKAIELDPSLAEGLREPLAALRSS